MHRRAARIAQAIRETVSTSILRDLRDPRIRNVTVLRVEVATDLRSAKVYVSIMGEDKTKFRSLQGLNSSCGYLQSRIADRLQTRYTPTLKFELDDPSQETPANEVNRILDELAAERGEVSLPVVDDDDDSLDRESHQPPNGDSSAAGEETSF